MPVTSHTFALLLALLTTGTMAMAETLYRWVDDKGQVTYQEQPPINKSFTREEVKPASGPASGTGTQKIEVVFYAVENCKACDLARRDLVTRGVKFSERNPEQDTDVGKALIERFGKVEVPVILVGDVSVKGYNPIWLEAELEKAGITSTEDNSASP